MTLEIGFHGGHDWLQFWRYEHLLAVGLCSLGCLMPPGHGDERKSPDVVPCLAAVELQATQLDSYNFLRGNYLHPMTRYLSALRKLLDEPHEEVNVEWGITSGLCYRRNMAVESMKAAGPWPILHPIVRRSLGDIEKGAPCGF